MTVDKVRSIALKLPHTTEDIKWGNDMCFSIAGKMYCVAVLAEEVKVSFKVEADEFDELCHRLGIVPAPYAARNKWVLVDQSAKLSPKELESRIRKSYDLVKQKLPKKIQSKCK